MNVGLYDKIALKIAVSHSELVLLRYLKFYGKKSAFSAGQNAPSAAAIRTVSRDGIARTAIGISPAASN